MIPRFLNPAAILSLLLLAVLSPQVFAQATPTNMKFVCDGVDVLAKTTVCELEVPADTVGTEMVIKVPKVNFTTLTGLKASNDIPSSGVFFKLNAVDSAPSVELSIDYADLTGKSTKTESFGLVQFTITLISVDPSLFPITIPGELQTGSVIYNDASLAEGVPSFEASVGTALPIILNLGSSTTTTGATDGGGGGSDPLNSTFTFEGGGGGGGGSSIFKGSPTRYCFDDPISSMTDAEWEIVCTAKDRGIVSGNPRPDGVFFFPNQAINRAEAVKILTLGVLKSLGKLSTADFDAETLKIKNSSGTESFITYKDILYDDNKEQPWFAVYVNIATRFRIVHGYREDKTYRAVNKINNAESYRTIVEAGRVASGEIAKRLTESTILTRDKDWFMKYAQTLESYGVDHSTDYGNFTARKDYLIIVMILLDKVGL